MFAPVVPVRNIKIVMGNLTHNNIVLALIIVEGRVLITQRYTHVDQGGKWEFPGGKQELHESSLHALQRECREELGITVTEAQPFMQFATVFDVWQVLAFEGHATACCAQDLRWVPLYDLRSYDFPEANQALLDKIVPFWTQQWQSAFKKVDDLLVYLGLSRDDVLLVDDHSDFPLRVPLAFADRMEKGNPHDPLLMQVLPLMQERIQVPGFTTDPLGEKQANPLPGLLHKYHGRVLLTLSGACGIHCRYCFRRHFAYKDNNPGTKGWEPVFAYLAQHPDINEVILSGGDPLTVDDERLESFIQRLAAIPSVRYLRFHTRMPVVLPARITPKLLSILAASRFRMTMVLHSNHANEWNEFLRLPMKQLSMSGVTLLNQAVLLKGVNDRLADQVALSCRLYEYGVLPYYLHLLDKVAGASHFDLDQAQVLSLRQGMIEVLPGYLVPKFVYEAAGEKSKIPL